MNLRGTCINMCVFNSLAKTDSQIDIGFHQLFREWYIKQVGEWAWPTQQFAVLSAKRRWADYRWELGWGSSGFALRKCGHPDWEKNSNASRVHQGGPIATTIVSFWPCDRSVLGRNWLIGKRQHLFPPNCIQLSLNLKFHIQEFSRWVLKALVGLPGGPIMQTADLPIVKLLSVGPGR